MKFSELRAQLRGVWSGHWSTGRGAYPPTLTATSIHGRRWEARLVTNARTRRLAQDGKSLQAALDNLAWLVAYCPQEFGLEPED